MKLFTLPDFDAHEQVSFFADGELRMIVAIHRLGPLGTAGGGCRMHAYADEQAALIDVLRLSRAMSYKLALLEVPVGGAKAVVLGDPRRHKSETLLRAVGRSVERLGGRFIVAEDVGTGPADLDVIGKETRWVSPHSGGADTAEATAQGVFACLERAVEVRLGRGTLDGLTVAVQGLGRVGRGLAERLLERGARLTVCDVDARATEKLRATVVPPEKIFDVHADVFAPCALGGVLTAENIARLRCAVIAGGANNQLATPDIAGRLAARGVLYAPDFVINTGGVVGSQTARVRTLFDEVLARAARDQVTPHAAAENLARERFAAMGGRL